MKYSPERCDVLSLLCCSLLALCVRGIPRTLNRWYEGANCTHYVSVSSRVASHFRIYPSHSHWFDRSQSSRSYFLIAIVDCESIAKPSYQSPATVDSFANSICGAVWVYFVDFHWVDSAASGSLFRGHIHHQHPTTVPSWNRTTETCCKVKR